MDRFDKAVVATGAFIFLAIGLLIGMGVGVLIQSSKEPRVEHVRVDGKTVACVHGYRAISCDWAGAR